MAQITEDLVRRKAEHNECIISTLEELSLHQENITRIEHLHNWCRDLKILLLQSNLIAKIENLFKLKNLEYLNLALNSIERVENLEQLESLNKLDLTLNFIGEITSIESLSDNYNLRELILTGNPCCDYPNYRDYVIGVLPQLERLDCEEITNTHKLIAKRNLTRNRSIMVQKQAQYAMQRDEQKIRVQQQREELEAQMSTVDDEDERLKLFWQTKSENCPEVRADIAKYHNKHKTDAQKEKGNENKKKTPTLFTADGRPYNLNQTKLDFLFQDEAKEYILELKVYKHMDTSLMDVDVQTNYIRVTVKKKIFQIYLADEVKPDEATVQRSQITGALLVKAPKLNVKETLIFKTKEGTKDQKLKKNQGDSFVELMGTVCLNDICDEFANLPDLIDESDIIVEGKEDTK